jgi:hypothetical protein
MTSQSGNVGMSSCCLSGKVKEGKPTGRVEEIGELRTYVSAPENGSKEKSIIFLVDSKIFPFSLPSSKSKLKTYSIRLGIPKRPPPSRQLRQSRLLRLRPRRPRKRLPPRLLPPRRRTTSLHTRESLPRRERNQNRKSGRDIRTMVNQAS